MRNMTHLSFMLRQYRIRNNITQKDMAERLGVSINTLYMWENTGRRPAFKSLMMLADLFGQNLTEIMDESEHVYISESDWEYETEADVSDDMEEAV